MMDFLAIVGFWVGFALLALIASVAFPDAGRVLDGDPTEDEDDEPEDADSPLQ